MNGEKRFRITDPKVLSYLEDTVRPYDGLIGGLSCGKSRRELPTAEKVTLRLLEIIVMTMQPERILEIGTAEGHSAIVMATASKQCIIDTIECSFEAAGIARLNFKKAGFTERINLIAGDAEDVLKNIDRKYDLVFMDAAKAQYVRYYDLCADMVEAGGIIFADNVLYRGMTAGGDRINRRQQLLVHRLREYINKAVNDDRFVTDVLPIGDGVCLSCRKRS